MLKQTYLKIEIILYILSSVLVSIILTLMVLDFQDYDEITYLFSLEEGSLSLRTESRYD